MNNRNIIIGAALAGVVLAGAILAVACSSQETPEKIDLSTNDNIAVVHKISFLLYAENCHFLYSLKV